MNETKLFFLQYQRCAERIREAEQTIKETEATIDSVKIKYDGMPRGSSISKRTENLALQLVEANERRRELIADAVRTQREIEHVIDGIDNAQHARLLFDRYVALWPWRKVADDLHVDETHARSRLHGAALESARVTMEKIKNQKK